MMVGGWQGLKEDAEVVWYVLELEDNQYIEKTIPTTLIRQGFTWSHPHYQLGAAGLLRDMF